MKARAFLYILLLFLVQHITFGESMGGWALAPENVVIVANKDAWHSLELAKYYMKKRNIPTDNLIKLKAPAEENCSRDDYEKYIASPIKTFLIKNRPRRHQISLFSNHVWPTIASQPS